MKSGEDKLKDKVSRLKRAHNETYHSGIKCTSKEAWQNSPYGEYAKKFRRGYRETFKVGDEVRVAKSTNLVSKPKEWKWELLKRRCQGIRIWSKWLVVS